MTMQWNDKSKRLGKFFIGLTFVAAVIWLGAVMVSGYAVIESLSAFYYGEPDSVVLLLFLVSLMFSIWMSLVLSCGLVHARWLVRSVELEEYEIKIKSCYGTNFTLHKKNVFKVLRVPKSFFYKYMTIMSRDSDSYVITTKQGRKYYLNSGMGELDALLSELEKLAKENNDNLSQGVLEQSNTGGKLYFGIKNYAVHFLLIMTMIFISFGLYAFITSAFQNDMAWLQNVCNGIIIFGGIYSIVNIAFSIFNTRFFVRKVDVVADDIKILTACLNKFIIRMADVESFLAFKGHESIANLLVLFERNETYVIKTKQGKVFYFSADLESVNWLQTKINQRQKV